MYIRIVHGLVQLCPNSQDLEDSSRQISRNDQDLILVVGFRTSLQSQLVIINTPVPRPISLSYRLFLPPNGPNETQHWLTLLWTPFPPAHCQ